MASISLETFERQMGRVRTRPPFGFSARSWPFIRAMIAASVISLAYYLTADRLIDWQPASWDVADRFALVIKCAAVSMFPLVAAVILVACQRLNPSYFEGTMVKPASPLGVNSRFVQNSIEQTILLFVGLGCLAQYIDPVDATTVPIVTALFVVGRLIYWWGYHHNTYVRSFGFGVTFYPLVVVYAWLALHMTTGIYITI